MSYLVPDTEIAGTGTWTVYGSGSSSVDRINTYPAPDTTNGILTSTSTTLGTIAFGLTNPSISVDTSADVKIGLTAGAEDPLGIGAFTGTLTLKQGGIAGTEIAVHSFSRNIDPSPSYVEDTTTLSAGEKAAVSDWTDLCLVLSAPDPGLASGQFNLAEIWLEYTEGAGPGTSTRKRSHLMLMGLG